MNLGGFLMLGFTWAIIIILTVYCFYKVLAKKE